MTLLDRWEGFRYRRWNGRRQRGRFTVYGGFTASEVPLPSVWADFTECSVGVGAQLGGAPGRGDPLADVSLAVELPGWIADALVLAWPGIDRCERRDAWHRLRTGYSFRASVPSSEATPPPPCREDP